MSAAVPVGSIGAASSDGGNGVGIDAGKGDLIDRLAALFQRARLWKRRARQLLAEARVSGDSATVHEARVRYGRACHWRAALYRRYVQAVFEEYC